MHNNFPVWPFLLGALFFMVSCSDSGSEFKVLPSEASAYIAEYTSGIISAQSEVIVVLTEDLGAGIVPGTPLEEAVFTFDPEIKGRTVWKSSRSLAFIPDRLASGQQYDAAFHLGKLREVPAAIKTVAFSFQVIEQAFTLHSYRLEPYSNADFTWNKLYLTLRSTDVATLGEVEGMGLDGIDRPFEWEVDATGRLFTGVLDSVMRMEEPRVFQWTEGDALRDSLVIPSIRDFRLLDQTPVQLPNQRLTLTFSSPIAADQPWLGMFQLGGVDVEEVEIDGPRVTLIPEEPLIGLAEFRVAQGLRNARGELLPTDVVGEVEFTAEKPAVRFASSGNIVAGSGEAVVPISVVNLKAVDVRVYQVYEGNMLQFFQSNDLDEGGKLRSVARPVAERRVELGMESEGKWAHYGLDLDQIIRREPGAIYRLELHFRPSYSLYPCTADIADPAPFAPNPDQFGPYYSEPWSVPGYTYSERDNPCHVSYYTPGRKATKNVLISDVGLVVKSGGDTWHAYVSDLPSGQATSGAEVTFFNYQGQPMGSARSTAQGKASVALDGTPFMAVATVGRQKAYVKLERGASLSVSAFDVGGEHVEDGVQAMLYAERGIWHPGDSIHLDAILDDRPNPLPADHPLVLNVFSPQGQLVLRKVHLRGRQTLFNLGFAVAADAPTGTYRAELVIGSKTFTKSLPVESVQPNRLDVQLEPLTDRLEMEGTSTQAVLHGEWLTGARAQGLRYEVKGGLYRDAQAFGERWGAYQFFDPLRNVATLSDDVLAEGFLDAQGDALVKVELGDLSQQPGPLVFKSYVRMYEPSGRFSIAAKALPLSPHRAYVGMKLPEPGEAGWLNTDEVHEIGLVRLNAAGKPEAGRVRVEVYKVDWDWWYSAQNGRSTYLSSDSKRLLSAHEQLLTGGVGSVEVEVDDADWGRILVVVQDVDGTHQATQTAYFDWDYHRDRSDRSDEGGNPGVVAIELDRDRYEVGEQVTLRVPSAAGGRLLLSLENGREQVADHILATTPGETTVTFTVTADMSPTLYAHALIVQPYAGRSNDRPIRLYGIAPIAVIDPGRTLDIAVTAPESVKPHAPLPIRITERSGKPMEYTLAVVDEGLLGLTNFSTPDPHAHFSKRQALGVRTWDVYEWVMNAFGGRLERVLAVGGDAALLKEQEEHADRFESVVEHLGPFTLAAGATAEHTLPIGNYIGNVRVMVVGANADRASGSAEANVRVKQDLMVQLTAPRQLAPEETVELPVTVFAMKPGLGRVQIRLQSNDLITFDTPTATLEFDEEGQQTAYFHGVVKRAVGAAEITVDASAGALRSTDSERLNVRYPIGRQQQVVRAEVGSAPWQHAVEPFGIAASHEAVLQLSRLPSMNLAERLDYLLNYPHGCLEQVVSKGLVQLQLGDWMDLTAEEARSAQDHVVAALNAVQMRQLPSGGFRYWPSNRAPHPWASTYAGQFLVAAEAAGYALPPGVLNGYVAYERKEARRWAFVEGSSEEMQAYRLYVLARAQQPELGAMTRLMNRRDLSNEARFLLAAAYAAAGEQRVAQEVMQPCVAPDRTQHWRHATFGSRVRDLAMWVMALDQTGQPEAARQLARELAERLGDGWCSTQDIAFSLHVLSQIFEPAAQQALEAEVVIDGVPQVHVTSLPVLEIPVPSGAQVEVRNRSTGPLFADVFATAIPRYGEEVVRAEGLLLDVSYFDANGLPATLSALTVGTSAKVQVRVKRTQAGGSPARMAVRIPLADGWEVTNTRLSGAAGNAGVEAEDFRDDEVRTYFDLAYGETRVLEYELIATYPGRFYLPGVYVEAMYDGGMQAAQAGQWVTVSAR